MVNNRLVAAMKPWSRRYMLAAWGFALASVCAFAQDAPAAASSAAQVASAAKPAISAAGQWVAPSDWSIYLLMFGMMAGLFISLMWIKSALNARGSWSLADALSEEGSVQAVKIVRDAQGNESRTLEFDPTGKPIMVPGLVASSSRLIALMGMLVILFLFIGFGLLAMFSFAHTGVMPQSVKDILTFLVAGLTLFAPYAVNKFAGMFQNLTR